MSYTPANIQRFEQRVREAHTILILQPDSPDGDSFGSALGLEEILSDLGHEVAMYAYKEAEPYLRVHEGWDRVAQTLPKHFDLIILVDTGTPALIKSALKHHGPALMAKPMVVIDHHVSRDDFGFAVEEIVTPAAAAAEIITQICLDLDWLINERAAAKLATAILSDSLGLTATYTTAHTVEMLAELVRRGAVLSELHRIKREVSALSPELLHIKGQLLASVEYHADQKLAIAVIPPDMVLRYKDVHEPYALIINDMQWVRGVELVAVFKNYGTKINVPMRSVGAVAGPVAELMGGGGHPSAAAYRCASTDIEQEKAKLIERYTHYVQEQAHAAV